MFIDLFLNAINLHPNHFILYKNDGRFQTSSESFEDVLDPYILRENAYRYIDYKPQRGYGLNDYPEHVYQRDLIAVKKNGLWGFINMNKDLRLTIPHAYEEVRPFKENYAAVRINDKWGYINRSGRMVVNPSYDFVYDFFHGLSVVAIGDTPWRNAKWGIIKPDGSVVLDPSIPNGFERIFSFFEEEIAKADLGNGKMAVIDRNGKILIRNIMNVGERGGPRNPDFPFNQGEFAIMMSLKEPEATNYSSKDMVYGAFTRKGEWVIPLQEGDYRSINTKAKQFYSENNIPIVKKDPESKSYGYVNRSGEWIISPQFRYARSFTDGMALVDTPNGKSGYIDADGKWIIEPLYDRAYDFYNSYIMIYLNKKYGFIDRKGNTLIEPEYDRINQYEISNGPIWVKKGNFEGFVDHHGNIIFKLEDAQKTIPFKNGITFIYTPLEEPDYKTGRQLFKVQVINEKGEYMFNQNFIETVKLNLI